MAPSDPDKTAESSRDRTVGGGRRYAALPDDTDAPNYRQAEDARLVAALRDPAAIAQGGTDEGIVMKKQISAYPLRLLRRASGQAPEPEDRLT